MKLQDLKVGESKVVASNLSLEMMIIPNEHSLVRYIADQLGSNFKKFQGKDLEAALGEKFKYEVTTGGGPGGAHATISMRGKSGNFHLNYVFQDVKGNMPTLKDIELFGNNIPSTKVHSVQDVIHAVQKARGN